MKPRKLKLTRTAAAALCAAVAQTACAQQISQPVILQWFEGSYKTMEYRMPDYFMAGYGGLWTPPPGRADSGNTSVGYDQYDRFDLGSAGNPTLYGTETGLKDMIAQLHNASGKAYLDLVWNHDGFDQWGSTDSSGHSFLNAGGYPGFYMSTGNGSWGDFHDPSLTGDQNGQLSGLIDIDHSTTNNFIRNPVTAGDPNNVPAGTQSAYGRLANIPMSANRRFYPDQSQGGINVTDPITGNSTLYNFGPTAATNGTPVTENALGYLMRNARWLIQDTGADGFRLDATKNYSNWVLNYFDKAVYKAITKPLLDGSQQWVWSFGENFDTNWSNLQSTTRLDINSKPDNTVGGNRDTLDFPLFYAMQSNLSNNGLNNDWRNVTGASFDGNDDGNANDGTQGVAFVQSHDSSGTPPYLGNVAYAYTLMRPGNAIVYFNGDEFGSRSFPLQGRGDALGGQYGSTITTLVDIRNRYGIGNYIQRSFTSATSTAKEDLVYERQNEAIVALSNRLDNGYDVVSNISTSFAAGTPLIELTGNANDPTINSDGTIPKVVVVGANGVISGLEIPRNKNTNGVEHDKGYVIYGPSGPQGTLSVSNIAQTLAPDTQNANNNGTARLTPIDVIKSDSFSVTLSTNAVTLHKNDGNPVRDHDADGDNALIKIDGGIDLNGNGHVDFVTPGSTSYGFENFTTTNVPGYTSADNNGLFAQNIDATQLSEGYHYIEVRAFRHRGDGGPPIYSSFKDVIYVDRLPPNTALQSFAGAGTSTTLTATAQSVDLTANNVKMFLDLPANTTDAQILALSSGQSTQTDRDLWALNFANVGSGNHVVTILTYEIDGNYSIKRVPGQLVTTSKGQGLADTNFDGSITSADISGTGAFDSVLNSNGSQFNAAADLNGDGLVDDNDASLLLPWLTYKNVSSTVINTANSVRLSRAMNANVPLNILSGTANVSGTIVPAVPMTLTNTFSIASNKAIHKTGSGTLNIQGPQLHGTNALLSTEGGTTNMATDGGSSLTVNTSGSGATTNFLSNQHLKAVTIGPGGNVTLAAQSTLVTQSLAIDSGGLDLNDGYLIVSYGTNASPNSSIRNWLINGRNGGAAQPGAWNGQGGITSSYAHNNGNGFNLAIGYGDNQDLALVNSSGSYSSFGGQTVSSSSVLVRLTYGGDATLDGVVDAQDVTILGSHFMKPGSGQWVFGDFDYSGTCDATDVTTLGSTFGKTTPTLSPAQMTAEFGAAFTQAFEAGQAGAVPEPAGLSVLGVAYVTLARRRRARRAR